MCVGSGGLLLWGETLAIFVTGHSAARRASPLLYFLVPLFLPSLTANVWFCMSIVTAAVCIRQLFIPFAFFPRVHYAMVLSHAKEGEREKEGGERERSESGSLRETAGNSAEKA